MEKIELIERAKMYLQLLNNGVHPVTGEEIPSDSVFMDTKVKNCFTFVTEILDEYVEMSAKVEELEREKEKNTVVVLQKEEFFITQEQCDNIKLSPKPITILAFMKNINSAINAETMEKLTSTRLNKWLSQRGLVSAQKVPTMVNKLYTSQLILLQKLG